MMRLRVSFDHKMLRRSRQVSKNHNFQIRILLTQGGSLLGKSLTTANADAAANGDSRDSDAASVANPGGSPAGVYGVISFNTGNAGVNNHTYDVGFVNTIYSIGNRVWLDNGAGGGTVNDGMQNGAEAGIAGVSVSLFVDADNNGQPDTPATPAATVTTDSNGYYRFDGLLADKYVVRINPSSFAAGQPLNGLFSSTTTVSTAANQNDRKDNGVDNPNPATNGILSGTLDLATKSIPTTETDNQTPGTYGAGSTTGAESANADTDLTVDFAFVSVYSLGNRVWYDTDNSGTINGAETGINGVKVRLLRSPALTQAADISGNTVADQTTAGGGYYRFDNLPAGDYVVEVAAMNFNSGMPLFQYTSSTVDEANPNADVDSNDNGLGGLSNATTGIRSGVVTLGPGLNSEPTNDNDPATNPLTGEALNGLSNRTVDFGFFRLCVGNLVWNDANNNGVVDAGEPGLGGLMVELLDAAGNVVQTTTTATDGAYSFCGLLPGDYTVRAMLPAGYVSSVGAGSATGPYEPAPDPDDNLDNNDNGSNVAGQTGKVVSLPITLTAGSEPLVDNATATTTNNTLDFGAFQPSDLTIRKTHQMNPFMTGMNGDYTITVTNLGPGATVGAITVTDTLPVGLTFISATGTGWTCVAVGQTVTCTNPGPLANGAVGTLTLTVGVFNAAAPAVTNTATVTVATDINPANNTATDPTAVTNGLGGPGNAFPEVSPMSDQKAGSLLIYPVYSSDAANPSRENTRINLTNLDVAKSVCAHLFFVDGASCSVADSYICLTPQQTTSFLMSDLDPGTTGYVVAVAVDDNGCPIAFNKLIGDEYVKFSSGHQANLAAESYAALYSGVLPGCNDQATTATLNLDGLQYNLTGKALAASNIGSTADGNNPMLVLTRTGGNLGLGAGTLGNLFGIVYDDTETSLSFTVASSACQLRRTLSNDFPRTTPRLSQFIPAGRTGWFKVWMTGNGGMIGAILNANSNAASTGGAFNGGHNLHALTLTNDSFLIPIFPPNR